jgi:hypothetical protein
MTRFEEPNENIPPEAGELENSGDEGYRIPNLFWAALLIFSINLMIVIWFYFSPGFTVRLGGFHPEQTSVVAEAKPSVFTEVVDETPKPVKAAMKVRPVVYDVPALAPQLDVPAHTIPAAYDIPMPRSSMPRATTPAMPRASTPAMPRKSEPESISMPKTSDPLLRHTTTIEVRPRTEPPRVVQ